MLKSSYEKSDLNALISFQNESNQQDTPLYQLETRLNKFNIFDVLNIVNGNKALKRFRATNEVRRRDHIRNSSHFS